MLQKQDLQLTDKPCEAFVTRYARTDVAPKAIILYFHGGGLLYGSRNDLPDYHIERLTQEGYEILSFDYPLAPAVDLELILSYICDAINTFCVAAKLLMDIPLPYFLWGRSAGAYLSLIAAASGRLKKSPSGILSYYGYGFLCDGWYSTPSSYYLNLPPINEDCLKNIPQEIHANGTLDTHYSVYVYARQSGKWSSLIYHGREKFFYLNYSLRTCTKLPCPLFAAHSTGDPDVPYAEFIELCNRYTAQMFVASGNVHDFDREPNNQFTSALLDATLFFLEKNIK